VAAGIAAPLLRRRVKLPKSVVIGAAAVAPAALCVAAPKTRMRDLSVVVLQMWAYLAAYELPNDDPEVLRARVHVDYPVKIDSILGLGKIPSQRLQETFSRRGEINRFERVLVWCHWLWFGVPHLSLAYIALRRREHLTSSATRMYAVFDLGAMVYWTLPTAPPWWAAQQGAIGRSDAVNGRHASDLAAGPGAHELEPPVRRMMLEYGEEFWGSRWKDLYDVLGGNPLAAMPSLHFATSLMAARLLWEVDPVAGALGWVYAGTLGLSLVYLGEHYVVDVIAGATLAEAVNRVSRPLGPAARMLPRALDALRAIGEDG
jgi:membrane-associated phospholipid phosphatase